MSSIIVDHKVVGTSSWVSKGFTVVTHLAQITNEVSLLLAYY